MNRPRQPLEVPLRSERATREDALSFLIAYLQLYNACSDARDSGKAPQECPVEYAHLSRRYVSKAVLVWMLYQGHADHFHLVSDGEREKWEKNGSTAVEDHSCFALTPRGEEFAEILIEKLLVPGNREEFQQGWGLLRVGDLTPRYDANNRVLSWGVHSLKRYRQPSESQEIVLQTAEELEWMAWFDDPLPLMQDTNPKTRLHDTIKNLNRFQKPPLVHFKGDGSGRKVGWELK